MARFKLSCRLKLFLLLSSLLFCSGWSRREKLIKFFAGKKTELSERMHPAFPEAFRFHSKSLNRRNRWAARSIPSLNKYLSAYYVPGVILSVRQ